jgi:hypothetical protein
MLGNERLRVQTEPPLPARKEWESRIPRSKLRESARCKIKIDDEPFRISDRLFRFLTFLDNQAGVQDYDTTSNEHLAFLLHRSVPTVEKLHQAAEKKGLTHRIKIGGRIDEVTGRPQYTGRVATFLLWRPTSNQPVATKETLDQSIARMREGMEKRAKRLPFSAPKAPNAHRFRGATPIDFEGQRPSISRGAPSLREADKPLEATTTTGADVGAQAPPVIHACESSSSSLDARREEPEESRNLDTPALQFTPEPQAEPAIAAELLPAMPAGKAPGRIQDGPALNSALLTEAIVAGVLAKLCGRFDAKMPAAPDHSEVQAWVAGHGPELVGVAAEMIERGKLRARRGILTFLETHHGRDPDWVRADAGLPRRPKPAAATPPKPPPPEEPESREELEARIVKLKAKRHLKKFEQDMIDAAEQTLAALDKAGADPGGRDRR